MSGSGPLFFEDFQPGQTWTTTGRTITEADVVSFAGLTGDFSSIHVDAEFSRRTPFGERVAHGLLGLSVFTGLLAQLRLTEGTAIALLGLSDWKFRDAIFIGDTISGRITIDSVRDTSRPDRGLIFRRCELIKQNGVVAQEGVIVSLVRKRAAEPQKEREDPESG